MLPELPDPGKLLYFNPNMSNVLAMKVTRRWGYHYSILKLFEALNQVGFTLTPQELVHWRRKQRYGTVRIGRHSYYLVPAGEVDPDQALQLICDQLAPER